MKLNRPEWPYAVVGIAGSVVSGCMNPTFALVVSQTLKSYYNADHKKMEREISRYSLFFVGLGGLSILGYFGQHFFFGIMGDNLVKRVREKMFAGKSITF
jgi:ATP-binding cassette subfamily B (MDR/TAP) protein 1